MGPPSRSSVPIFTSPLLSIQCLTGATYKVPSPFSPSSSHLSSLFPTHKMTATLWSAAPNSTFLLSLASTQSRGRAVHRRRPCRTPCVLMSARSCSRWTTLTKRTRCALSWLFAQHVSLMPAVLGAVSIRHACMSHNSKQEGGRAGSYRCRHTDGTGRGARGRV